MRRSLLLGEKLGKIVRKIYWFAYLKRFKFVGLWSIIESFPHVTCEGFVDFH